MKYRSYFCLSDTHILSELRICFRIERGFVIGSPAGLFYFVSLNCNVYNYLFIAKLFTYIEGAFLLLYCVNGYIPNNISLVMLYVLEIQINKHDLNTNLDPNSIHLA